MMNDGFEFLGVPDCYLIKEEYRYGRSLALLVFSLSEGPMARITTNITGSRYPKARLGRNEAFLDTNNCPEALELVERLGIGRFTGIMGQSGYCIYPLYEFDMTELEKYVLEEDYARLPYFLHA